MQAYYLIKEFMSALCRSHRSLCMECFGSLTPEQLSGQPQPEGSIQHSRGTMSSRDRGIETRAATVSAAIVVRRSARTRMIVYSLRTLLNFKKRYRCLASMNRFEELTKT